MATPKLYDIFVAGYDLLKIGGTSFFHTSAVVCPPGARVSHDELQDGYLHESVSRDSTYSFQYLGVDQKVLVRTYTAEDHSSAAFVPAKDPRRSLQQICLFSRKI